ncbi:MAG: hypothetical protein CMQ45_07180 [Gammaproteobacteria bacterium]|nr:hypothetical protein [Gammaproteobacteria bacterium]
MNAEACASTDTLAICPKQFEHAGGTKKSGSTLAQDKRIVNLNYDHVLHFRSQLTGSYDAVTQGEEGSKKEVEVGHIFVAHP